jgi:lauroyl/myristoyl acyltransferase
MAIDLQRILNSSSGLRLASALAHTAPPSLGHRIAYLIADLFSSRKNARVVRAIRGNQWVIRGENPDPAALDAAVRETFRQSARSIFDLHHYIENMEAVRRLIFLDEGAQAMAGRAEFESQGMLAVGLHMSSFDLILQWMCKQGLKPLVLTIPAPQGGRRIEYESRLKLGMNLVPASASALHMAIKHLQKGGLVVTGIDRPIPDPTFRPCFFGHPSTLPIHHVYLAQKARVPLHIYAASFQPDGCYHVESSPAVEMDSLPCRDTETLRNAEKVLSIAEGFIRRAPEQWSVPLAVWPDLVDKVPSV